MALTLVTSTADAILLERPLSVGRISASSVPDRPQVPLWPTAVIPMPIPTPITTATEINQQQQYYPTRQPGTSTVQQKDPVIAQSHYPPPHQTLSRNFYQPTEHSTVENGQQGPSTVDSGQVLQQLAASVAVKLRKCPKFSGESKYDDFDHWQFCIGNPETEGTVPVYADSRSTTSGIQSTAIQTTPADYSRVCYRSGTDVHPHFFTQVPCRSRYRMSPPVQSRTGR